MWIYKHNKVYKLPAEAAIVAQCLWVLKMSQVSEEYSFI